jgi:hypothetical protein
LARGATLSGERLPCVGPAEGPGHGGVEISDELLDPGLQHLLAYLHASRSRDFRSAVSTKIEIGSSSSVMPLSSRESKAGIIVERHHVGSLKGEPVTGFESNRLVPWFHIELPALPRWARRPIQRPYL